MAVLVLYCLPSLAQVIYYDKTRDGFLVFHEIRTDNEGKIVPWYSDDLGASYDHVINLVWNFWDTMRADMNGLPYYMNHQVWRPDNDPRGLGGDQLNMALSSWRLLYMYSGNEKVKENMKFIADYYLNHSLSTSDAAWPNIPYPYNTMIYSGHYDGDMVIGKGYTQPDKAGSFGYELLNLYKITGNENYLDAAVDIANTLAKNTKQGDNDNSPMPFKVNAVNGEVGILKSNAHDGSVAGKSSYTTNWSATLQLWLDLIELGLDNSSLYQNSFDLILDWMKEYPMKTNKWGPFFEDIPGWSDTQINAVTFCQFIMNNQQFFPDWRSEVRGVLHWVYNELGNDQWINYGVKVINEQTVYQTPGNSHTSRQASAELQYAKLTGDKSWYENAVRQLNWATYMVDHDGKNNYPRDEVWLTDGYGDYVRHYLRSMAAEPTLAPSDKNHILHSTSVVTQADYAPNLNKRLAFFVPKEEVDRVAIYYHTFDSTAEETIRMTSKPSSILAGYTELKEVAELTSDGWIWLPLEKGGILKIRHSKSNRVKIFKY